MLKSNKIVTYYKHFFIIEIQWKWKLLNVITDIVIIWLMHSVSLSRYIIVTKNDFQFPSKIKQQSSKQDEPAQHQHLKILKQLQD